jgi:hypothetical protein
MKPPVNIDDLLEQWSNDAPVNETNPSKELARIPNLHAKYLRILTHHNLVVKKLTVDYNSLKSIKLQYYAGDLNNPEDLKEYGYEPWVKNSSKYDIPRLIDGDSDLNLILMKKVIHQEIVDVCTSIIKEITNRTYQLNSIVKWEISQRGQ